MHDALYEARLERPPVLQIDGREIVEARFVSPGELASLPLETGVRRYLERCAPALIDQGRRTTDRAQRAALYVELQRIVQYELPYISLWHEDVVVVYRRGLTGYRPLPNASFFELWRTGWGPAE